MTSAWFSHILALPGAQKPEGGGSWHLPTDPWTEARLEADRARCQQKPRGTGWPGRWQGLEVSLAVPSGACVALCGCFLTLCFPLRAPCSDKRGPSVTPVSASLSHLSSSSPDP